LGNEFLVDVRGHPTNIVTKLEDGVFILLELEHLQPLKAPRPKSGAI
jgi:hypothetical protein